MISGILKKLQNQPESTRKIIFWIIIILISGSLLILWVRSFRARMQGLQKEDLMQEFNVPSLQENLPPAQLPELPKEELEELEKMLKEQESQGNLSPSPSNTASPAPSNTPSPTSPNIP